MKLGDFLMEKATNMAIWIQESVGKENLEVDVVERIKSMKNVNVIILANLLLENKTTVSHRDWNKLHALIASSEFVCAFHAVKKRPYLHEKFWRYMDLFVEVAEDVGSKISNN